MPLRPNRFEYTCAGLTGIDLGTGRICSDRVNDDPHYRGEEWIIDYWVQDNSDEIRPVWFGAYRGLRCAFQVDQH